MNEFFKNLKNEIKKIEGLTRSNTSLGEQLAQEAYTQILQHKLNVVGQKIYDYYAEAQSVDIPEFMKAKQDMLITKVRVDLQNILLNGKLDELYKSAIEKEK